MSNHEIESGSWSDRQELSQLAMLACILEVTASKPGNVHRGADFDDVSYIDFLASAVATGPILAAAPLRGVGRTVLAAVAATRQVAATNTNLGTLLLLAPLAAVPRDVGLRAGIRQVLASMTADDSTRVYEAIRLACPGGLPRVADLDVALDAPDDLLAAMEAAADRDLVARQYTNEFAQVFAAVDWLLATRGESASLREAIIRTHLRLMAEFPDSLIARKCGWEVARESAHRASHALAAGPCGDPAYQSAVADFDFWLRADNHRRNPGTTADLIAAALFVSLREEHLHPPFK